MKIEHQLRNKTILVFGGTGSLGQAIVRRFSKLNRIHLVSRDEAKHWTLRNRWKSPENISFSVGDVRDQLRVREIMTRVQPEIVIIAAALKHVDTCEHSPSESIKTNIEGTENVIESALELELFKNLERKKIECVLFVSTDKACAPTNVYGMCKSISERLISSANLRAREVKFVSVRYGNVLESRGSIIPLFKFQVENSRSLTVTDTRMTRFIMSLDDSIDLIQAAILNANPGETWIPKLESMGILDLAELFSERYQKKIEIVGMRPGEKLHEELISESESMRAWQKDNVWVLETPIQPKETSKTLFSYSSEGTKIPKERLARILGEKGIFERSLIEFEGRQIEEIRTTSEMI